MKIVSLLPGATEIVCALGLEQQLVGISHECDYPESIRHLPKVTSDLFPPDLSSAEIDQMVRERLRGERTLYQLEKERLAELEPDLLITQTLCEVCAVSQREVSEVACSLPGNPEIVNLEPESLEGLKQAILMVGQAAGVPERASILVGELNLRIQKIASRARALAHHPRVLFLEWLDPPFTSGHWNPELVTLAGGRDLFGTPGKPSRNLSWEEIRATQAEVIFIACCGFNLERTAKDLELLTRVPGWSQIPAVISGRVYLTDGAQYFSRPGPRLIDSLELLAHGLHPEVFPLPDRLRPAITLEEAESISGKNRGEN